MALRIAYLILAHKCPPQVARLVQRLQGPERKFVIHVDRNSPSIEWDAAFSSLLQPNVLWADRVACVWGGFSLVEATLNCIETLNQAKWRADFVVLLSGQDYPIKSNQYIEEFLAARSGECLMFFHRFPYPEWCWNGYHRLPTWRVPLAGKQRRIVPTFLAPRFHHKVPCGYHPCGGSQWWALPGEATEYVLQFLRNRPEFVAYFKRSLFPDEMVFHTILGNSPYQVNSGNHHLHFIRWGNAPNPAVLTTSDLPALRASGKCFARKFDTGREDSLLDLVDAELLGVPGLEPRSVTKLG